MKPYCSFACLLLFSKLSFGIIDIHTHQSGSGTDKLLTSMNLNEVDFSVILSDGFYYNKKLSLEENLENTKRSNNTLFDQIKKGNGSLIGFCGVPIQPVWATSEITRCKNVLGFRGVKLHPNTNKIDLRSSKELDKLETIFRKANELELLILIDSVWLDSKVTLNVLLLTLKYPKMKLILAHAFYTHFRDLFLISAHGTPANIFVDLSGILVDFANHPEKDLLVWHLRKLGIDHVLFGSDSPSLYSQAKSIHALEKYPFTVTEKNKILDTNSRLILNLEK